jgi:hypothetical protein
MDVKIRQLCTKRSEYSRMNIMLFLERIKLLSIFVFYKLALQIKQTTSLVVCTFNIKTLSFLLDSIDAKFNTKNYLPR